MTTTVVAATRSLVPEARRLVDAACSASGVTLQVAHDLPATAHVAAVLTAVWGRTEPQLVDPALLIAMAHAGNLVLVALREGEPVGAAVGFCGPPGAPFHSHIVGLLPHATGRGVGRAIKLAQRAWCLERGIDAITWTFDPLVARNAGFNIGRLGARVVEYLPDFYGAMTDAINIGQHSDRLLVRWDLTAVPPTATYRAQVPDDGHLAVGRSGDVPSACTPYVAPPEAASTALVAIPPDIESLRRADPARAGEWRDVTRAAFTDLMTAGWAVSDFVPSGSYVFHRKVVA